MASVYYLFDDSIHIADDIVQKYSQRDRNLKDLHLAAIFIQRAYRGYVVRKNLKIMRQAATTLQKYIRGWMVRFKLPERLQEEHDRQCLLWYHRMATKLQACWKGLIVRREINIKQIMEAKRRAQENLFGLGGDLLIEKEEDNENEQEKREIDAPDSGTYPGQDRFYKERILEMLFDRHHLLRTKQTAGVLSNSELAVIEKVLASLSWSNYIRNLRKLYNKYYKQKGTPVKTYMFTNKTLRKQEDLFRISDNRHDKKETMVELYQDITSNRKPFHLTSKVEKLPYERSSFLQGPYTNTKFTVTRLEDKSKNVCDKDFILSLKKIVKDSKVPPYYADFWYRECDGHNFID